MFIYILVRNEKVFKFQLKLNAMIFVHHTLCNKNRIPIIVNYDDIPNYFRMVLSFKQLTLDHWFTGKQAYILRDAKARKDEAKEFEKQFMFEPMMHIYNNL